MGTVHQCFAAQRKPTILPQARRGDVSVEHLLTDNERDFGGRPLHCPNGLFLAIGRTPTAPVKGSTCSLRCP